MKVNMKRLLTVLFCSVVLAVAGCSTKIPQGKSQWRTIQIKADGQGRDWPEIPPQYYDQETRTSIRVMNDQEAVYIYATIGDQDIKHELMQAGFTLSLDLRENAATSFAITVKGQMPPGRLGKKEDSGSNSGSGPAGSGQAGSDQAGSDQAGSDQAGSVHPSRQDGPGQDMKRDLIKLPETLVVTYPYSSGPMTMTLSEARDNGIELGMGNLENGTLVIEAVVRLDALVSDENSVPATRMMLTLASQGKGLSGNGSKISGNGSEHSGKGKSGGAGPPGGGMHQGKGGAGKTKEAFQARIDVLLVPGPV